MTVDELKKEVSKGRQYRKIDNEGYAEGCLLPLYLLYPTLPKREWIADDLVIGSYLINNYFSKTDKMDIGNVMAYRMPFKMVHLAVFCGNSQMVHCSISDGLSICNTSLYISRIMGVFKFG